jgi:hypothetical protein
VHIIYVVLIFLVLVASREYLNKLLSTFLKCGFTLIKLSEEHLRPQNKKDAMYKLEHTLYAIEPSNVGRRGSSAEPNSTQRIGAA